MFCNDCLTAATPELKIRVRERSKTQAKIPENSPCLSFWVGFGAARTEV